MIALTALIVVSKGGFKDERKHSYCLTENSVAASEFSTGTKEWKCKWCKDIYTEKERATVKMPQSNIKDILCPESVTLISAYRRGVGRGGFTDYYNDKTHTHLYWTKSRIISSLGGMIAKSTARTVFFELFGRM